MNYIRTQDFLKKTFKIENECYLFYLLNYFKIPIDNVELVKSESTISFNKILY